MAVEASTPTWHFADAIVPHVGELRIVDSLKTRLKAGYAAKTDRLDARRLADALRRDSVVGIYHPPLEIRELRELCRGRHTLVQLRTRLLQRLRALLLRHGIVEARRLVRRDAVLDGLVLPPRAAATVASLRRMLAGVRAEITTIDRDVQQLAQQDPIAIRLQQIPGVGPVLALLIRAEIGEVRRFPTPGHLATRGWCRAWRRARAGTATAALLDADRRGCDGRSSKRPCMARDGRMRPAAGSDA